MKQINIAIIGLGFGAEFIPIYQKHPDAHLIGICQRSESKLNEIGDAFGIEKRYTSYDELLKDPAIDAVHINTPIPNHGEQSIKALKAGKHVACTVPMATTVGGVRGNRPPYRGNGTHLYDDGDRGLCQGVSLYE